MDFICHVSGFIYGIYKNTCGDTWHMQNMLRIFDIMAANLFQFEIAKDLLWESLKLLSCLNGFDFKNKPVFTCTKPLEETAFNTLRLSMIQPCLAADMVELIIFTLLLCSKKPESSQDARGQADAQEPSWL